jgi:hypothetical protein
MSDLFLDLRDRPAVIDFLVENLDYAPPKDRAKAAEFIKAYGEEKRIPTDKLAEAARLLAIAAWPARYAMNRFFREEGADEEWERLTASIRPSTAHLLKRFRQASGTESLDATLEHAEADTALHDAERLEITEVRQHLRQDYWREKSNNLALLKKDGEAHLGGYLHRLGKLRDLAVTLPRNLQDEVFSKLQHYEDRIFFEGELVPLEILDEEIKYYIDQKEISPMD